MVCNVKTIICCEIAALLLFEKAENKLKMRPAMAHLRRKRKKFLI